MRAPFADRAVEALRAAGHPLCVGVDPFPDRIPALFGTAAAALEAFSLELVARAAAMGAPAVKPQLGLFEPFGAAGFAAAQAVCAAARAAGLIVILDAKRGDIGSTAEGYAEAAFGPAFAADVVTVNPYLGLDSLEPFIARASVAGCGVAVLVRTSNPGAKDLQDLMVDGAPLWRRTAEMIAPLAERLRGASGWSGLMSVAGATYPAEARALRAVLPDSLFLVPGYGAQGGSAEEAVAGFKPGPGGAMGGFVNASRAVAYPAAAAGAGTLAAWRTAVDAAIEAAAAPLRHAIAVYKL